MANRILRDWTTSEIIDALSPEAEVLFTRLIMKADDYGSFYANPKLIRAALFPLKQYSDGQIRQWVDECVIARVIFLYNAEGKDLLRISNFGQRLRNMRSAFPQPTDNSQQVAASVGEKPPETKRNEEKRIEGETTRGAAAFTRDCYTSAKNAYEEISANYQDFERAKQILTNRGWAAVVDREAKAVLYHFLETKSKLEENKTEVRRHFQNWLHREPLENLRELAKTIITNHERSRQPA